VIVSDEGDGFVPQPGPLLDQSPAQINVLAGLERLVESAQLLEHGGAADDRRTGDIRHGSVGNHRRFPQSEVQRGSHGLVARHQVLRLAQADDSRCDQRDRRITEVAEQRLQPPAPRHHIGVQERDVVGVARSHAGVAGGGGTLAAVVPQDLNIAVHLREVGLLYRGGRPVVDHDDSHAAEGCHQST
jgi:hypothetical protein